jgi:chemotaxis protein histidine kinase CheA
MMQSCEQKPQNLEQKVNELKLSQRNLEFQQKANKLKMEGAKFQFLSFSKVCTKMEGIEAIFLETEKDPNSFTLEWLQLMLEEARAAKAMMDHRLEFIGRADGLPGGWRVLTKFEQMMQSKPGKDPEQEKMWHAAVKAVDKEKKTKATSSHPFKKPEYKAVKGRSGIFKFNLTP